MNGTKYFFGVVLLLMALYYAYPLLKRSDFANQKNTQSLVLTKGQWQEYSDKLLEEAITNKTPIIIDFWADWCEACIELENGPFKDPQVTAITKDFALFKFDRTLGSKEFDRLKEKYNIKGLPHIVFYNNDGTQVKEATLTGIDSVEGILNRLNQCQ